MAHAITSVVSMYHAVLKWYEQRRNLTVRLNILLTVGSEKAPMALDDDNVTHLFAADGAPSTTSMNISRETLHHRKAVVCQLLEKVHPRLIGLRRSTRGIILTK